MKSICVFCGSSSGFDPRFAEAARAVGDHLASADVRLIYGGGKIGLMGTLADAALAAGGEVIGVIPRMLIEREVGHEGLTELRIVESMLERKTHMVELSDGFIALPGGTGTLDELFEVWTWAQLGLHTKPLGILDVAGFYGGLIEFLDHVARQGFARQEQRSMLLIDDDPGRLLDRMRAFRSPIAGKWLDRDGR